MVLQLKDIFSPIRQAARRSYCISPLARGAGTSEIDLYVDYYEAKSRVGQGPLWTPERVDYTKKKWREVAINRLAKSGELAIIKQAFLRGGK